MTKLHEMSKKELMETIYNFYNPELVGNLQTIVLVGMYQEDEPVISYSLDNGIYEKRIFDIKTRGEGNSWEKTTEEEFKAHFMKELESMPMNLLYVQYLQGEWARGRVREINSLKETNKFLIRLMDKMEAKEEEV